MPATTILHHLTRNFTAATASEKITRHRLTVFLLGTVAGLIGFPLHIIGVWGSSDAILQGASLANEAGLLVIFIACLAKRLSLPRALSCYGVVMQVCLSAKIIYIAMSPPPNAGFLMLFNSFISLLIVLVLVMGYMHAMPLVLTAASAVTWIAAYLIRPGCIQPQFVIFFLFVEFFCCALGMMMRRDISDMEKENNDFRAEEAGILKAFNMSKDELMAYISISKNGCHDTKDVNEFFDNIDERTERNILNAVRMRETEIRMRDADIMRAFPTLSATEADVCRLVLHGKTLKEIARLTDKTPNNISAVRIHIRKKLGLATGQDLKEFLEKEMRTPRK